MFKRMSIQTRVVLSTAAVLAIVCIAITVGIMTASRSEIIATLEINGIVSDSKQTAQGILHGGTKTGDYTFQIDALGIMTGVLKKSLLIMTVAILVGIIAVCFLVKQALRPVSQLCQTISKIDEKKLNQPLPVPPSKDEIAELTKSFNRMMARLNHSFEAQKQFSATAAHELKTPLSAILTNIDVLELDQHPAYAECLDTIAVAKENASRMKRLIQDLLQTYSSNLVSKKDPCDLEKICQKCCILYSETDKNAVAFSIEGSGIVEGDPLLLERAIGNLIGNAFRYNRPGGTVRITLTEETMTIRDTGSGIKESDLGRIFEPFYRADISRSRNSGGSGLGLSIAKNIFDAHNADISVESKVNEGTVFIVRFAGKTK